jgi:predicted membrane-bound spermidine synthase
MKKFYLEIVVFVSGAVVMAYEIIGSRMLGPYVGTSITVWSAIIGVILMSLSLGYYLGGRLADRKPEFSLLAKIIIAAAVFIILSTAIKDVLLTSLLEFINNVKAVSVLASLILFSVPGFLLGMVSPFAARLKISSLKTTGATVGNLYAISTVGSITGTFLAGFYLIPTFAVSHILYLLSTSLILFGTGLFFVYKPQAIASTKKQ